MTQPDERMTELRELFFETAQELLQALNDEALKLEKHPGDSEIVRSLRRIVHTLKGDAAACGYRELSEVAHELEDALALESAAANATLAEVAFTAADLFAAMLAAYRKRAKLPSRDPLRKMVKKLSDEPGSKRGTKKKAAVSAQALGWTEYEKLAVQKAQEAGNFVYHVQAQIDPHCAMPIAGRQLVQNALATLGEILAARPEAGAPAATKQVEFLLATSKTTEEVVGKCQIPTIVAGVKTDLLPGEVAQPAEAAPKRIPKTGAAEASAASETSLSHQLEVSSDIHEPATEHGPQSHATLAENILRVDSERIDSVLNLVGELIIGKSMLQQALNEFSKTYPKDALRGRFADAMAFQARVLNDLQRSVMKIRMVPVEQLFRRFPRMVRDVARQCGKDVELVVSGQDTDLDKSILDAIAEPLTHLVRNAIGHGLETAEERKQAGKSEQGTLHLSAYHQGNQVIVEVRDDGRGMDVQRIRAKAIDMGLTSKEDAARLNEAEIFDFVFRPGFSTAEQVTEVSGRGVGMDVVQSVLHRLKGSIHIETHPGQGTTFRLKLPLTLAIIKALLFEVQHRLYAVPLNAVVEIARTREGEVHQVDHYEVLQLRNQVLPLVRLGRPRASGADGANTKLFVLVISVGERKFGLIVDELEGEEELVIKALDDHAVSTDLVSGASILGDGRVVLILNLSAVVDHFARSRPAEAGAISSGLLLSHADRIRFSQAAGGQA
jgi:two-component system chemotaxis sensor kinase CheA